MSRSTSLLIAGCLVGALLAGCAVDAGPGSGGLEPTGDSEADRQVAIYAAVIRRLVTKDHTFGGEDPPFQVVYVVDKAVRAAGDVNGSRSRWGEGEPLPADVRQGVEASLSDLPPIRWVSDPSSVIGPDEQGGRVKNEGVLIAMGPISGTDNRVEVGTTLYFALLGGQWLTYVVEDGGGEWQVTGTTGPVAIS